jgi:glycosyltransferase involved in cell wall biosynthesis
MSISVVIPTHNRLDLVKQAIRTVIEQDIKNYELVIYDNSSKDDLRSYIKALENKNIIFGRSDDFLSVTESWNNAINLATKNYVILIGDDDGILPGALKKSLQLIDQYQSPDLIYSSILQFIHPGVAPRNIDGCVMHVKNASFFVNAHAPFFLDDKYRLSLVEDSIKLNRSFSFNMQAFIFKKKFLEKIRFHGNIFHSPFPDYYLANVAFYWAKNVLISPFPIAIQGVSKASFGFTLFNNLESKGEALLNNEISKDDIYKSCESLILPGKQYNTNYLVTMEYVINNTKTKKKFHVNSRKYRILQFIELFRANKFSTLESLYLNKNLRGNLRVTFFERLIILCLIYSYRYNFIKKYIFNKFINKISMIKFPAIVEIINSEGFNDTDDIFRRFVYGQDNSINFFNK